jgi:acetyl esterase/lipase
MHKKTAYRIITCCLILCAAASATHAADTLKATETFLLWPGTPPGARDGDDVKAAATAKAIKDGTYKIPGGNRSGIRVPACDVYLPPKAKRTGTGMVIYCGGGYSEVCIRLEGIPMAKWLNASGIAVFMVSYRCSPYKHPIPFWDVQRAIRLVRSRAKEFDVKTDQIGIMGFSAGGHVASTLSVHYKEAFGRKPIDAIDKVSARADFSCLIYPVISMRKEITHGGSRRNLLGKTPSDELVVKLSNDEQIDKNTPPAFLVHAKTDSVVKPINSQRYHDACKKNGVPSKYILMSAGHHWPGLKDGKPMISNSDEDYAEAMVKWIKEIVKG